MPQSVPTFEAGQTVPRLRGDLKVTADLSKEGVVTITDSRSGASHMVRDVELSLARMLNGQRTAQEVVEAAQRIGLPINLQSLTRFVGKLRGMGLLDEAPQGDPLSMLPGGTWPHRDPWPQETRELYQVALRAFRSEQLGHAKELLERQMREGPTVEAAELLAKVEQKLAARAGTGAPTFQEEWSSLEHSWFDAGERMGDAPAAPDAAAELDGPPKKRSRAPLIAVLLLVAGGAAAALVPIPATAQVSAALAARASQSVTAPRAGTLGAVEVKDGQWVEKGAVLVRYDAAAAGASVSVAKSAVDKLEAQLKKDRANPKRVKARAALDKANAALAKATAALDKAQAAAKGKKTGAVPSATKAQASAQKAIAAAEKALAAAGGDGEAKLEADLAAAKKDLEARQAEAGAVDVVAPAAGQVAGLQAKAGAAVTSGGALLRLDDTRVLRAELDVPAKDRGGLKVGQALSLKVGAKTIATTLSKADEAGVQAEVDNAAGALKAGDKGSATLSLGGRTLLGRL